MRKESHGPELPSDRKRLSRWIISTVAVCILIFLAVQNIHVLAAAFGWCVSLVSPLLIGCVIAMILNVPMRFFESVLWRRTRRPLLISLRRPLAFIISLVLIAGILVGVIGLVIPALFNAVAVLIQNATALVNRISTMDRAELAEFPFGSFIVNTDWNGLLQGAQNWLKEQGGTIVNTAFGTIGSLVGGIYQVFIAFIFAIYCLFSKDRLRAQATRLIEVWLPRPFGSWLIHAASVASHNFSNYISGQSLEAFILGTLCMTGMMLLGLPYAPMIGALVGVSALIPVVGGFIGSIVGGFMILTVDPVKALIFVIYLFILQQIEGNLIYPRVMGSRVNLPGMWILAAVTVGGGIAGPVGMLLSVPTASTAYTLLKEATAHRAQRRKAAEENPRPAGDPQ